MPNWHIDAICDHLEAVSSRQIKRLIVNIPPRHMKSLLAAVAWPTWEWGPGGRPSTRWLFASYGHELSIRDSIKCRRVISSPWYQERWGDAYRLTDDQNRKIRYDNDKMGYRFATSVGGALTGEGGDIIVIDDAHNAAEGESEAKRDATIEWWDQAMSTRLNDPKTGAYVLIMQRIHDRDLVGHVLAKNQGWDHLCLPGEYEPDHPHPSRTVLGFTDPRTEPGELLWPERVGPDQMTELRQTLGSYGYAGQIQQRPAPAEGGIFNRAWFRYYSDMGDYYTLHLPEGERRVPKSHTWRVLTADLALTESTMADYTVVQVWDVIKQTQEMILVDQWRAQVQAPMVEDQLRNMTVRWNPLYVAIENKHYGTAVIQRFSRDGLRVVKLEADRDKVTRAAMAAVWMENQRIFFPKDAAWLSAFEAEVQNFPMAPHDDQVDALAYAAIFCNSRNLWQEPPAQEFKGPAADVFRKVLRPMPKFATPDPFDR